MQYLQISENEYILVKGSPRTLFIYNQEFQRDLLFDLNEAYYGNEIINQAIASRIMWSLCKTANHNETSFSTWIKNVKYNFKECWKEQFINECNRAFEITLDEEEVDETSDKKEVETSANETALMILINSKKMGLTFEELDTFTINDFIKFSDVYSDTGNVKPNQASQEDIDNLFL